MKTPHEKAGDMIGERMPRLVAKQQTELVAMMAVYTDPLSRIARDRLFLETKLTPEMRKDIEMCLKFLDELGVEKELNDAVLKLQEAFGALDDLGAMFVKLGKVLDR